MTAADGMKNKLKPQYDAFENQRTYTKKETITDPEKINTHKKPTKQELCHD
jgi:hypothetical protein